MKYLGGNMRIFSLNFSRPAGQVVAQYYNFVRLGREGYTKITQGCSDVASWFADQVRKLDMFDLIHDGRSGIPGCAWTLKPDEDAGFTLYDLSNQLRIKGWQVPTYPLPPNRTDVIVQRVLMRLGVSRDLAGLLLNDLQRAIGDLEKSAIDTEEYGVMESAAWADGANSFAPGAVLAVAPQAGAVFGKRDSGSKPNFPSIENSRVQLQSFGTVPDRGSLVAGRGSGGLGSLVTRVDPHFRMAPDPKPSRSTSISFIRRDFCSTSGTAKKRNFRATTGLKLV